MNAPKQEVVVQQRQSFTLHIVLSCFTAWCCTCPCGLVAFILALVANDKASKGRSEEARTFGKASIGVSIAGIVIGIILIIVIVVVRVQAQQSHSENNGNSG
jgi:cytochrome bd-type quinol oxidase subunit 2